MQECDIKGSLKNDEIVNSIYESTLTIELEILTIVILQF